MIISAEFEIIKLLGTGGMGNVYLARDLSLNRQVAMKVLKEEHAKDPIAVERFLTEARAMATLTHPNIVTVHKAGVGELGPFFVMQYVEGQDLADRLSEQAALPFAMMLDLARQIAPAIDYAHSRGLVHRDIKPANILVDAGQRAFVADFGIARIDSQKGLTMTGIVVGTHDYMAPEQWRGQKITGAVDRYAFGILCYEMICGHPPFSANSSFELGKAHTEQRPPPPRTSSGPFSPAINRAFQRMLAKDPRDRYPSCVDFVKELERVQLDPIWGPRSRSRWVMGLAALCGIAGLGSVMLHFNESPAVSPSKPASSPSAAPHSTSPAPNQVRPIEIEHAQVAKIDPPVQPVNADRDEALSVFSGWLAAQNGHSFSRYQAYYASDFQGTKRTRSQKETHYGLSGWLKDRRKMVTNQGTVIEARNVKASQVQGAVTLEFDQIYRSPSYSDWGPKTLILRRAASGQPMRIWREELAASLPITSLPTR